MGKNDTHDILRTFAQAEPTRMPLPSESFNDEDLYVYRAETRQFVRSIGNASHTAREARTYGVSVNAGETWGKGLNVKDLGIWMPV